MLYEFKVKPEDVKNQTIAALFLKAREQRDKENKEGIPKITVETDVDEFNFVVQSTTLGYSVSAFLNGRSAFRADGFFPRNFLLKDLIINTAKHGMGENFPVDFDYLMGLTKETGV